MNFRKFISGVSALTIAASAFAGMAMTASATTSTATPTTVGDTVTVSGISPVIDAVFTGKTDTAANTTAEEMSFGKWYIGSANYGTFALLKFDWSSYLSTYSENYVLSAATLTMTSKWHGTAGEIQVSCANKISDSWDGTLLPSEVYKQYGNGSPSTIASKNQNGTYTSYDYDVTSALTTTDTDGIVTFGLQTPNNGRWVYVASNENTTLAGPTLTLTFKEKVTVNANVVAKCGATELSSTPISGYAGTSYSYAPYAYILQDGVYYKYDAIGSNGEVNTLSGTLSEGMSDIEITYTKVDNVIYYSEVDAHHYKLHSEFEGSAKNNKASGGMDAGTVYGSGACYQSFSVAKKGTYRITVNAVGTSSNNRSCVVAVDSTDSANAKATLACNNGATSVTSFEVDLEEGSHELDYIGTGGISPKLDYMVVELVREYVPYGVSAVTSIDIDGSTGAYTSGDNVWAKAYTFTVTPNDDKVTAVKVTDNAGKFVEKTGLNLTGTGAITFGILAAAKTETDLDGITFTPSITVE